MNAPTKWGMMAIYLLYLGLKVANVWQVGPPWSERALAIGDTACAIGVGYYIALLKYERKIFDS